jgi:hypothetical protein
MLFRRYLIPQAVARFRGAQSFYKHQDNLTENDIHFNNALRTTEEGSYVSTARFLIHGVYPALRQLKFDILSSNWNELSNDKKAGIKLAETGWDSEMHHYPHIFEVDNKMYMIYNGNEFGKYGIGLAELIEEL